MMRINKQSKTAESLANYLSSVEIANNENNRLQNKHTDYDSIFVHIQCHYNDY